MVDLRLDHIVIAVRSLEAAEQDYTALLGRRPSWRGSHPGWGTRNVLYRIDNTYIELLALAGGLTDSRRVGGLATFLTEQGEGLNAIALGTADVDSTVWELRGRGLEVQDPLDGRGVDATSGAERAWRNALIPPHATRGARVFLIEHRTPADALPVAEPHGEPGTFVKRMDHAVMLSPDVPAARKLWSETLGARLALDRTFPDRGTRILFFRLGDVTVEISGAPKPAADAGEKPDRFWGLAWGVDDLDATCERLQAAGIRTSGPRAGIKPGTRVATVRNEYTHGVATLLIEHTAQSFRPEARLPHSGAYDNAEERRAFTAKALDHIVLSTPDIDATAAKWSQTLGLGVQEIIEPPDAHLRLAKLPAGNAFIELAQPLTADHRLAQRIAERGPGMFSISVEVDDLDAAVRDLRAKGATVSDSEPGVWPGTRLARINKDSANGVSIQLIERQST